MSDLQDLCKKLHPVIKGIGDGSDFMVSSDGITWVDVDKALSALSFLGSCEFKEKPRTIKIGDFDVPEPLRVEPKTGSVVYYANPYPLDTAVQFAWGGSSAEKLLLARGMIHADMESAKIHAKAIVSFTELK